MRCSKLKFDSCFVVPCIHAISTIVVYDYVDVLLGRIGSVKLELCMYMYVLIHADCVLQCVNVY